MIESVIIREAVSGDAVYLTDLAIRSKAHWGYSTELMEACVDELSVSPAYIENSELHYVVAVVNGEVVGFYQLAELSGGKLTGTRESGSIPGRSLPMFQISL
jgi:hypothetical protein